MILVHIAKRIQMKKIFDNNKAWASKISAQDPEFFHKLSLQQSPKYLWIGCSDSRVPANQIIGLPPGDVFVHRNIANVIVYTDLNALSVIQYAVEVLEVEHIIVCGHYGCGGVKASMSNKEYGLIDNWLRHIKDVQRFHANTLDALKDEQERFDKLCELNVQEQVRNVRNTTIVKNAMKAGKNLQIHGTIYNINDGLLKDLNIASDDD